MAAEWVRTTCRPSATTTRDTRRQRRQPPPLTAAAVHCRCLQSQSSSPWWIPSRPSAERSEAEAGGGARRRCMDCSAGRRRRPPLTVPRPLCLLASPRLCSHTTAPHHTCCIIRCCDHCAIILHAAGYGYDCDCDSTATVAAAPPIRSLRRCCWSNSDCAGCSRRPPPLAYCHRTAPTALSRRLPSPSLT